jgi:hypothetical protein
VSQSMSDSQLLYYGKVGIHLIIVPIILLA